jgi:hypothetical protein
VTLGANFGHGHMDSLFRIVVSFKPSVILRERVNSGGL